jgi:hypothetical protein
MFATEIAADFGKRGVGEFLSEIHGDLARIGNLAGVAFHLDLRGLHVEALGDGANNGIDRDFAFGRRVEVLERLLGHRH